VLLLYFYRGDGPRLCNEYPVITVTIKYHGIIIVTFALTSGFVWPSYTLASILV
jgi:hypothetical protein